MGGALGATVREPLKIRKVSFVADVGRPCGDRAHADSGRRAI